MNPTKRAYKQGQSAGSPARNATNQMVKQPNKPSAIKNSVGVQPGGGGYSKIRGAVSG